MHQRRRVWGQLGLPPRRHDTLRDGAEGFVQQYGEAGNRLEPDAGDDQVVLVVGVALTRAPRGFAAAGSNSAGEPGGELIARPPAVPFPVGNWWDSVGAGPTR